MHVGFTCILHERKRLFCARNLCRMNGIPFKEVGDQSMMLDNDFQTCAKRGCSRVSLPLIYNSTTQQLSKSIFVLRDIDENLLIHYTQSM
jgi:hypothetical protein